MRKPPQDAELDRFSKRGPYRGKGDDTRRLQPVAAEGQVTFSSSKTGDTTKFLLVPSTAMTLLSRALVGPETVGCLPLIPPLPLSRVGVPQDSECAEAHVVVRNTFIDIVGLPQQLEGSPAGRRSRSCPASPSSETTASGGGFPNRAPDAADPAMARAPAKPRARARAQLCVPQDAPLGTPELPSMGSFGHDLRRCKPCAFVHVEKGCANGVDCPFCHLCEPGEKRRRQKLKAEKRRFRLQQARRAEE